MYNALWGLTVLPSVFVPLHAILCTQVGNQYNQVTATTIWAVYYTLLIICHVEGSGPFTIPDTSG